MLPPACTLTLCAPADRRGTSIPQAVFQRPQHRSDQVIDIVLGYGDAFDGRQRLPGCALAGQGRLEREKDQESRKSQTRKHLHG
jgi:hypothetical protein